MKSVMLVPVAIIDSRQFKRPLELRGICQLSYGLSRHALGVDLMAEPTVFAMGWRGGECHRNPALDLKAEAATKKDALLALTGRR